MPDDFLKNWFRGSVLEELLIPYTLPGLPVILLVAALLPPGTDGFSWNPLIALILCWGLSIVVGASFSALGRVANDCLLDLIPWDWCVSAKRNRQTIMAMGLDTEEKRYELLRSRLYLWAEFNKGMVFTVPIVMIFLQVLVERYFHQLPIPGWGPWLAYSFLMLVTIAHLLNWKRNLRRWEIFEGVPNGQESGDP